MEQARTSNVWICRLSCVELDTLRKKARDTEYLLLSFEFLWLQVNSRLLISSLLVSVGVNF